MFLPVEMATSGKRTALTTSTNAKKPCSGSWVEVNGHLKQIDGGHDYVNNADNIYVQPVEVGGKFQGNCTGHITAS